MANIQKFWTFYSITFNKIYINFYIPEILLAAKNKVMNKIGVVSGVMALKTGDR